MTHRVPPRANDGSGAVSGHGLFLALEGVEGVGKTTQARLLGEWLGELGLPYTLAREPGGTPVGEAIRQVLLDSGAMAVPDETELLLMLAARAAFVRGVVLPTLKRGEVMVTDRFELSTFAYQGAGRGLPLDRIRSLNAFATGGVRPDLTLVFDVPVEHGQARQRAAGKLQDRIEGEGNAFLERVRAGYLAMAAKDESVVVIDAGPPEDQVHARVRELLQLRFPEPFRPTRG
ncbi:MAG: dTMP kinase [Gemmatimonadota bacterium]